MDDEGEGSVNNEQLHKRYHHHLLIWLTRVGCEQHDLMIDVNVREYLKGVSTCFACASGG